MTLYLNLDGRQVTVEDTSTFKEAFFFAEELLRARHLKGVHLYRSHENYIVEWHAGMIWKKKGFPISSTTRASASSE